MGLPLAIKAHGEGNLTEAARQYERALDQNKVEPLLFQNYGALLRASGNEKKAEIIYKKGLSLYPNHSDILPNYANLLKAVGRSSEALQCYLTHLRFCVSSSSSCVLLSSRVSLLTSLNCLFDTDD